MIGTKTFFACIYIAATILVVQAALQCAGRKEKIAGSIYKMLVAMSVSIFFYTISLLSNEIFLMKLGNRMYTAGIACMLFFMLEYALAYTDVRKEGKREKLKFLAVVILLDVLIVCIDALFDLETTYQVHSIGKSRFMVVQSGVVDEIHQGICLIMVITVIGLMLYKRFQVAEVYRLRYTAIAEALAAVILLKFFYNSQPFLVNFIVLAYAFVCMLMYYLSIYYVPQSLNSRMQDYIITVMHNPIIMFDDNEICVAENEQTEQIFGEETFLGKTREEIAQKLGLQNREGQKVERKEITIKIEGTRMYYLVLFQTLQDDKGRYIGSFYLFNDITEVKNLAKEQEYIANHDVLTGLYNRAKFIAETQKLLKENPTQKYVMVASDMERFKVMNDLFGGDVCDKILIHLADELRDLARGGETYGRMDSDRFICCIPMERFSEENTKKYAYRKLKIEDKEYQTVTNYGIYFIEDHDTPVQLLCDRAFLALKSIKGDYNQNIAYYDEKLRVSLLENQMITSEMEEALMEEQFELYLQPQYNQGTRHYVGAEALVRWNHPVRGMISPGSFIPLFESNGFITRLDQYVWEKACQIAKKWHAEGRDNISISVNISQKDLYFIDVAEYISNLIKKYEIPAKMIKLEITESACFMDPTKIIATIRRMKQYGFVVELDDFGSGYSSLNMLKDIPVDILKLDMAFVRECMNEERSSNIMQAVITMANKLGMPVIAEGVETKEQSEKLEKAGCEIIQGYYYGRPAPLAEFEALIQGTRCNELMAEWRQGREKRDMQEKIHFYRECFQETPFNVCILRMIKKETEIDAEVIFANGQFHKTVGKEGQNIEGSLFSEIFERPDQEILKMHLGAIESEKTMTRILYSTSLKRMLHFHCYFLMEGCCVSVTSYAE